MTGLHLCRMQSCLRQVHRKQPPAGPNPGRLICLRSPRIMIRSRRAEHSPVLHLPHGGMLPDSVMQGSGGLMRHPGAGHALCLCQALQP